MRNFPGLCTTKPLFEKARDDFDDAFFLLKDDKGFDILNPLTKTCILRCLENKNAHEVYCVTTARLVQTTAQLITRRFSAVKMLKYRQAQKDLQSQIEVTPDHDILVRSRKTKAKLSTSVKANSAATHHGTIDQKLTQSDVGSGSTLGRHGFPTNREEPIVSNQASRQKPNLQKRRKLTRSSALSLARSTSRAQDKAEVTVKVLKVVPAQSSIRFPWTRQVKGENLEQLHSSGFFRRIELPKKKIVRTPANLVILSSEAAVARPNSMLTTPTMFYHKKKRGTYRQSSFSMARGLWLTAAMLDSLRQEQSRDIPLDLPLLGIDRENPQEGRILGTVTERDDAADSRAEKKEVQARQPLGAEIESTGLVPDTRNNSYTSGSRRSSTPAASEGNSSLMQPDELGARASEPGRDLPLRVLATAVVDSDQNGQNKAVRAENMHPGSVPEPEDMPRAEQCSIADIIEVHGLRVSEVTYRHGPIRLEKASSVRSCRASSVIGLDAWDVLPSSQDQQEKDDAVIEGILAFFAHVPAVTGVAETLGSAELGVNTGQTGPRRPVRPESAPHVDTLLAAQNNATLGPSPMTRIATSRSLPIPKSAGSGRQFGHTVRPGRTDEEKSSFHRPSSLAILFSRKWSRR